MRARRSLAASALVAGLATQLAAAANAQDVAYLPLDEPAYATIDALVARGALPRLSSLERPYRAAEVRDAIDSALAAEARGIALVAPRRWYSSVRATASRYSPGDGRGGRDGRDGIAASAALTPFVTAQTSGGRELMLADSLDGVHPGAHLRLGLAFRNVAAVSRLRMDRALRDDDEYLGKKDRAVVARMEDAYIAARWRYAAVDLGRLARNWGPSAFDGMQIGRYSDSYDHLQLRLGVPALHLTTAVARLDDMLAAVGPGDTAVAQRYMTVHRLTARWRGLELAAGEQVVYGGPGRGFEPSLANPVGLLDLNQYSEGLALNVSYGLDAALRTRAFGSFAAQLLVDDVQLDECGANCEEPPSWGLTATFEGVPAVTGVRLFGAYTRISNLAYRTPTPWERVTFRNLSLGRGRSDYDEVRAGVELAPPLGGPLRMYGAFRRQGEGDYRLPFPPASANRETPSIFAGTVMRVARVGAQWSATGMVEAIADVGWQRTTNDAHDAGRRRSGFEGRVTVRVPFARSMRIRDDAGSTW